MGQQKSSSNRSYGIVLLIFLFVVFGMLYLAEKVRQISPAQPELTVDVDTTSSLAITAVVIETECENVTTIDYSLVELSISGGKPPYDLTITNSKFQLLGPFSVASNNTPIQIKIYGGDFFRAEIHSYAGENWSAMIALPTEAKICNIFPTDTLEPTDTNTPVPTHTEIITPSLVYTQILPSPLYETATNTKRPGTGTTNTQASPHITVTTYSQSSDTPLPKSTDTPHPQSTNTPRPQPTDTPRTQPTNTPRPQPSVTPINPNPHACEDGIDNDGDGLTDYPADPDCKKPSDTHEDK